MSSSRLPGKVLRPIHGKPMLLWQVERIRKSKNIDKLVIVTSTDSSDDELVEFCQKEGIDIFRGSLHDVLERYYQASLEFQADNFVRVTGDCPLLDPNILDQVVSMHLESDCDYTSNITPPSYPDGMDVEVFTREALGRAQKEATKDSDREHVTLFMRNQDSFSRMNLVNETDLSEMRLTVDEASDVTVIENLLSHFDKDINITLDDIVKLRSEKPELFSANDEITRDEGLAKSIKEEKMKEFNQRYKKSMELLERACKSIPLGSQTFSKSKTQFPYGVSPYFIEKAKGSKAWDVDGNEYVDFMNALLCVSLGHCDPEVTKAVKDQLESGTIFSLPHILETEVAEMLVDIIPCAESVRFGKNGSDATSAAIRLGRAYTKRDKVAVCGYHGWQDWYIGSTTKNLGVPQDVSNLTCKFDYNNIESLEKLFTDHPGEIGTVIMEPMNVAYPKNNFLEKVKEVAHKNGAILVFDEMITGFRFSTGGASELFGVTPDLACFGKGLANGYPVSAIAGKKEIMDLMEDIFFSGTFGGETLSLAAAKATLTKLKSENVCEDIKVKGQKVLDKLQAMINDHGLEKHFALAGHPSWSFFMPLVDGPFDVWEVKTLFMQEMLMNGILTFGTHNISYAHSEQDLETLFNAYQAFFETYKKAVNDKNIDKYIFGTKLEPLFKVR